MTDKELLLIDLSARLPHGVICDRLGHPKKLLSVSPYKKYPLEFDNGEYMPSDFKVEDIKPYLRPLSSMTEQEKDELYTYIDWVAKIDENGNLVVDEYTGLIYSDTCQKYIDWLNKHHFDYRGLIEKGLALVAPEGMYKEG
jgi:hypothetical protein